MGPGLAGRAQPCWRPPGLPAAGGFAGGKAALSENAARLRLLQPASRALPAVNWIIYTNDAVGAREGGLFNIHARISGTEQESISQKRQGYFTER